MKETLLALDFDGTLYRQETIDSEDMLLEEAASTDEEKEYLRNTYRVLGTSEDWSPFTEALRHLLRGKPLSLIDRVIDRVMEQTDLSEMEKLRKSAGRDDVHLYIVSCGSDMLSREFLKRTGLLPCTEGLFAKVLLHDKGVFTGVDDKMKGADDKKRVIAELRMKHPGSVIAALGDGSSDRGMIESADLGFYIEWPGGRKCPIAGEKVHSISEFLERTGL